MGLTSDDGNDDGNSDIIHVFQVPEAGHGSRTPLGTLGHNQYPKSIEPPQALKRSRSEKPLMVFYRTGIRLLYRMARDFFLTTKKGNELLSEAGSSLEARLLGITIARMAVLSKGLEKSSVDFVENIMSVLLPASAQMRKNHFSL